MTFADAALLAYLAGMKGVVFLFAVALVATLVALAVVLKRG